MAPRLRGGDDDDGWQNDFFRPFLVIPAQAGIQLMPCCQAPPQRLAADAECLADRAGVDADEAVERAKADKAREQRHDTDPTPWRMRANEHERDKDKTEDDAQRAIKCAFVAGHAMNPLCG
jgi:hypothetical protein